MPAFTAEAQKRRAPRDRGTFGDGPFDTTEDFTLYDRCITRGIVGSVLRVVYGNGNRIVQAPGMVAISYEMIHDTRVMYTDGRSHISPNIRQLLGDSRARWEGDELVVETTNMTDRTSIGGNGNGLRHSAKMVITERFKRVADDVLQYQFTVDDPVTYEKPFTMSFPLTPLDGGLLLPYECHEGNLAILQSLGAERAEDRALAQDLQRGIIRPRRGVQESGPGGGGNRGRGAGAAAPAAHTRPRGRELTDRARLFVKPRSFDGGLATCQQASACWHKSLRPRGGRGVQGRRRRRPQGAKPWMPCSPRGIVGCRSVRGPRRRRTIEGASTTSHADIRWLPQLPAAEHT